MIDFVYSVQSKTSFSGAKRECSLSLSAPGLFLQQCNRLLPFDCNKGGGGVLQWGGGGEKGRPGAKLNICRSVKNHVLVHSF